MYAIRITDRLGLGFVMSLVSDDILEAVAIARAYDVAFYHVTVYSDPNAILFDNNWL